MTIIAAYTSLIELSASLGSISASTTATDIAPYAKEGVMVAASTTAYAEIPVPNLDEFWVSFYSRIAVNTAGNYNPIVTLQDTTGQVVRIVHHIAQGFIDRKPDNATNTNVGSYVSNANLRRFDIYFKRGVTDGALKVWIDGVSYADVTNVDTDTRGLPVSAIRFTPPINTSGHNHHFSAVIIADEDTRNFDFVQLVPNADGSESGWTGSYAAIDETASDSADYIEALSADLTKTWGLTDVPGALSSYEVKSLWLMNRAQGSAGVTTVQPAVKVGGAVYAVDPTTATTSGAYGANRAKFDTNPNTGAPWTVSDLNALEVGVRSKA